MSKRPFAFCCFLQLFAAFSCVWSADRQIVRNRFSAKVFPFFPVWLVDWGADLGLLRSVGDFFLPPFAFSSFSELFAFPSFSQLFPNFCLYDAWDQRGSLSVCTTDHTANENRV